jgi:anthranilate phosphoribosyltransferase
MREKAVPICAADGEYVVDTCGTGGDGSGTFNISTAVAFVAAGAGLNVAKHGNRSVSSQCGSADVLEALGVNINLPPGKVERCAGGIFFSPLSSAINMRSLHVKRSASAPFQYLGPLANPAGVRIHLSGSTVRPDAGGAEVPKPGSRSASSLRKILG